MSAMSRTRLIDWVNETLQLHIAKVDDLGTGAEYCQILDSIFGDVPMYKVRFNSRQRRDWESNFKILQQVFARHNISRNFDVLRLMRCRLQDNLDFTQYLYQYWHSQQRVSGYDPVARRSKRMSTMSSTSSIGGASVARKASGASIAASSTPYVGGRNSRAGSVTSMSEPANDGAFEQLRKLDAENMALRESVHVLEQERSYYYQRLVDVEKLVNTKLEELYARHGNNDTQVNDDGCVAFIRQVQAVMLAHPENGDNAGMGGDITEMPEANGYLTQPESAMTHQSQPYLVENYPESHIRQEYMGVQPQPQQIPELEPESVPPTDMALEPQPHDLEAEYEEF